MRYILQLIAVAAALMILPAIIGAITAPLGKVASKSVADLQAENTTVANSIVSGIENLISTANAAAQDVTGYVGTLAILAVVSVVLAAFGLTKLFGFW